MTRFYNSAYSSLRIFLQGAHPILNSSLMQSFISFWMLQQVSRLDAIQMIFITLQQTAKVVSTSSGCSMAHNLLMVSILQLPSTLQMMSLRRLFREQCYGLFRVSLLKVIRYLVEPRISAFLRSRLTKRRRISFLKAVPGHFNSPCMVKKRSQAIQAIIPGELRSTFAQYISSLSISQQTQPQYVMRLLVKYRRTARSQYPLEVYLRLCTMPFRLSTSCSHNFFLGWQLTERRQSRKQQQAQAAILDYFMVGGYAMWESFLQGLSFFLSSMMSKQSLAYFSAYSICAPGYTSHENFQGMRVRLPRKLRANCDSSQFLIQRVTIHLAFSNNLGLFSSKVLTVSSSHFSDFNLVFLQNQRTRRVAYMASWSSSRNWSLLELMRDSNIFMQKWQMFYESSRVSRERQYLA